LKSSAKNIKLASVDDLFKTDEGRADDERERVQEIVISELHPFKDHPFKVLDDEKMMETVESVQQYGVLFPIIARPSPEGGYEIVSGHRRHRACELAGKETMPVIVRDLDDDEAVLLMEDSNLQREIILPSERAYAFKMKKDAVERRMGRPKKEGQIVPDYFGKRTTEVVAEGTGESYKQVQRYIRLTELIPPLLEMVDERKIAFNPAYELSFLKSKEQEMLIETMDYEQATPSLSQAQRLKQFSQDGRLTEDSMLAIMSEEKKPVQDRVMFTSDVLRKYFPKDYTPRKMEETIIQLLEQWKQRRQMQQEQQRKKRNSR